MFYFVFFKYGFYSECEKTTHCKISGVIQNTPPMPVGFLPEIQQVFLFCMGGIRENVRLQELDSCFPTAKDMLEVDP